MKLPIYVINAFAEADFEGNPAAVCLLSHWLSEYLMQRIAAQHNLSETAFVVPQNGDYAIRWFTPTTEVDLCGHATLAAAWVIFNTQQLTADTPIVFHSNSGPLTVTATNDQFAMDFPQQRLSSAAQHSGQVTQALGITALECWSGDDLVTIVGSEDEVLNCQPNLAMVAQLPFRGIIITAPGINTDFVCRFFAPQSGIDEDPVTGSAYTEIAPYWAENLQKNTLSARQLSSRGGKVACKLLPDQRILISGPARLYMEGTILVD